MASGRITKEAVEAIRKGSEDAYLWDEKLKGYGVKVTPGGKRVYLIQYRLGGRKGRTRRVTIGVHGTKTEHEARKEAKRLLGEVQSGSDPAAQRDKLRDAETFGHALDRFLVSHSDAKLKSSTSREYRRIMGLHVPQKLRSRLLTEVGRGDITRLHDAMRASPYQGNRVLAVLGKFFNWCEGQGIRPANSNPCHQVEKFRENGRERFLTTDELARLGAALHVAETEGLPWEVDEDAATAKHIPRPESRFTTVSEFVTAAIRLLIFTGARHSEILTLKWEHVDIPGQQLRLPEFKTGRKSIYLNPPALEVLAKLPRLEGNPHVICGEKEGAHLVNLQKPWRRIRKAAKLDDVRIHDLRHTFASWGAMGGLPLPIIGGLLSHSQPQTTQRYAHLSADPLKKANDTVGNALAGAMRGNEPGNIVPMRKGAK